MILFGQHLTKEFCFTPDIVPSINWYDPSGMIVNTGVAGQLFPSESGDYTVELINSAGCYYTDTFSYTSFLHSTNYHTK